MATIDWPANLRPQTFSPGLRKAGLQFRSPFNGTTQSVDFVAERWVFSLALPPRRTADGNPGQVEALINRLAGGVERVRCHHWYRPVPAGTLRGYPVLLSSVARGGTSLPIGRATAQHNLVAGGGFDVDSNSDGTADNWVLYDGTGGGSLSLVAGRVTGTAQRYTTASSVSTHQKGVQGGAFISWQTNTTYTLSFYAKAPTGSGFLGLPVRSRWNIDPSIVSVSAPGLTTAWQRYVYRFSFGAGPVEPDFVLYLAVEAGTETGSWDIDDVQLELGETATDFVSFPTLKAGDMLGCGGQLFQVADDVTLNDAGAGTVNVVNRVRAAISSAAAVSWNQPTAEFIMPASFGASNYRPAILEGMPMDLEEVW
jgi:hypothetical protein